MQGFAIFLGVTKGDQQQTFVNNRYYVSFSKNIVWQQYHVQPYILCH